MTASEQQSGSRERGAERPQRLVEVRGRTIVVARSAGYCYGVERALQITEQAVERSPKPIATLGPIIHNPSVVERLAERGAAVVEDVAALERGTVVVRTHGVPPAVIDEARRRGLTVVDATCPFVTVAQRKAAALREAGYAVVILGERDHPEVVGLSACAGEQAVVVEDPGELDAAALRGRRVGVVVQTTQSYGKLARLAEALAPLARETLIYNTICEATEQRQEAAREVAAMVDVVLVVGGRNSANTRRLAALCRELQPRTHHIERAAEIDPAWFIGVARVGITAGASTPDEEIDGAVEAVAGIIGLA